MFLNIQCRNTNMMSKATFFYKKCFKPPLYQDKMPSLVCLKLIQCLSWLLRDQIKNTQTGFFNFQLIFLLLKETNRKGLTYARASAGDRFWRQ